MVQQYYYHHYILVGLFLANGSILVAATILPSPPCTLPFPQTYVLVSGESA